MFPLFETIQVFNGEYQNLELHQQRMLSSAEILWGCKSPILDKVLIDIPKKYQQGKVKCRLSYNKDNVEIVFSNYFLPKIDSLKIVDTKSFDYSMKYSDRSKLNNLFPQKGICDDVIIVIDSNITDTSFCNIVVDIENSLFTPKTPLLKGIRRQAYIDEGRIKEAIISIDDIKNSNGIYLINAMISIEDDIFIPSLQVV